MPRFDASPWFVTPLFFVASPVSIQAAVKGGVWHMDQQVPCQCKKRASARGQPMSEMVNDDALAVTIPGRYGSPVEMKRSEMR